MGRRHAGSLTRWHYARRSGPAIDSTFDRDFSFRSLAPLRRCISLLQFLRPRESCCRRVTLAAPHASRTAPVLYAGLSLLQESLRGDQSRTIPRTSRDAVAGPSGLIILVSGCRRLFPL